MVLRLLLFPLLLTAFNVYAQPRSFHNPGDVFIRFNPLGVIDLSDFHLSFGVERILKNRFSAGVDAGWIYDSPLFERANRSRGFLLHPFMRYYRGPRTFYIESELRYRRVDHQFTDWLWRGVDNDVPSYEEFTSFRFRKQQASLNLKIGRVLPLTADGKLCWEPYMGMGLQRSKFTIVGEQNSAYTYNNWPWRWSSGEVHYRPSLLFGIRVSFSVHSRV